MLFNKKKRLQYLGFNDIWFMIIGIIILSFVTDYIFSNSFQKYPLRWAIISWSASLFFATCDWLIMREVLIRLRKGYPELKDSTKRNLLFFVAIVTTVITVDIFGGLFLEWAFGLTYSFEWRSKVIVPVILISTMTMAIYEAIYFYLKLKKSIREEEEAKRAIVQAQLDALRNQAQPHFLFNTLNTLRDIIDQNPKEDAKEFVDKIADVYRFILESGNAHLIPLRDELKFAKSYIHIQKERFGENLWVRWDLPEIAMAQMIVPMSLQLLLENAIKHNVISKSRPLSIQVKYIEGRLVVTNALQAKSTQLPSTKLGLQNIKRRYALISEEAVHVQNNGKHFVVSLPLLTLAEQNVS